MKDLADHAERLAKRRSIGAIVMATLLIVTQGQRMTGGRDGLIGWIVTGTVMVLFVVWASGLFRDRGLRGILNDEYSRLNWSRALTIGFWNMLATGAVCYGLTFVKDYEPGAAAQIIMTVGISSALIGFGVAERASVAPCRAS